MHLRHCAGCGFPCLERFVERHATLDDVVKMHGQVIVSKVAAIVKTRADGTEKLRIIIDMLRSSVNSFVRIEERIILPRLADMIADLIALAGALESGTDQYIDMTVLDFSDAFHTIGVAPGELRFQVFRLPDGGYGVYRTAVFGGGGSPLTWGRAAAFFGRSGQSLFPLDAVRIEIYVDDPWTAFRGTHGEIRRNKVILMLWWIVVGPELSWAKIAHGQSLKWIGAQVTIVSSYEFMISLPDDYAPELATEALRLLGVSAPPLQDVRKLTGRCSWAAGFVPALGAMIAPLWAAIADCMAGGAEQPQRTAPRLVPIIRIRLDLL